MVTAALLLSGCGNGSSEPQAQSRAHADASKPKTQALEIKGRRFELELALDPAAREQGLSDRKSIADDGGMLFVFTHAMTRGFVMRRCYVPIDLVFVDRKGYVDSMHRMQVIEPIGGPAWENPSGSYYSAGAVQYAIELKGGTLDALGLKRGDRIDLPIEALQSLAE